MTGACTQDDHVGPVELRRRGMGGKTLQHQCASCFRGVGKSQAFRRLPPWAAGLAYFAKPRSPRQPNSKRREYEKHLKSREWKDLRLEVFERDDYTCQRCAEGPLEEKDLECDHKTYKRLGSERPEDCQALCKDCHRAVTEERLLASVFGLPQGRGGRDAE